jgi:phage terminase small subunit
LPVEKFPTLRHSRAMALTTKQQAFVDAYLTNGGNATEAARTAGYAEKGIEQTASRTLSYVEVKQAIMDARREVSERSKVDAAWLLHRLSDEAKADISDLYDEHGALKPVREWPLIWRQGLVQGIEVEELSVDGAAVGRVRKVKLDNRVKRLELIGKHIGVKAFEDQVRVTGLDALADRLVRAAQRDE